MKTTCTALIAVSSLALSAAQDDYVLNKTTEAEEIHSGVALGQPAGGVYSQVPFALQFAGSPFFSLQTKDAAVDSGTVAEHAMTEISDYQFRVSAADRHLKLDFDAGSYNWLNPFGSTWKTLPAIDLMRTDHSSFDRTSFVVHGGTTYWPAVRFAGTALVEDRFVLDGGTHTFGGTLNIPYRSLNFYGKAGASTYRFDVTNGANVTIGGAMTIGANSSSDLYGTTVDKDIYLTVTAGSTLTLDANITQEKAGRHHVLIADSTVVNGGNFHFGPYEAAAAELITTDTLITNSLFQSPLNVYSGNARFVDSTVGASSGFIHLGWFSGARTTVDFVNCTTEYGDKNNWHEWPRSSGPCNLNFHGGSFSANYVNLAGSLADNGTGTVTVAGNANVAIATLRMGPRWGGLATLNVRSGTVTGSFELGGKNNNGSIVGGVGVINLSGGEIRSSSMTLGNSAVVSHASYASHPGTNLVHVTGGVFADTATSLSKVGKFVVCENASARPSRIALDGGEMRVNKLYGGDGAQVNGGESWAAFEADGGTLVAPFAASTPSLLYGFDEAALGNRGLTVVSDSGCTIAQNFSDKPGAEGRLVLAGQGVKTLTGEDSRESVLVAAGGTVEFAATARHYSDVVVTNGASVNFAGAAGSGMIGDLTLGDATTKGQLVLAKGVPIAVGGSLIVNHAQFVLGEGFALDTTSTVFTVAGGVSDDLIEALNESSFTGLPSGAAFEFIRESGQPGEPTAVKLAVCAATVIVVEAEEGSVATDSNEYAFRTADSLVAVSAADAELTLAGRLSRGGFAKQGAGTVYLTNEANRFLGSVVLYEGRLSVSSMLALGYDAGGTGVFSLKGGTLELADASDPAVFPYSLEISPDAANAAVVVKTDGDTVFHSLVPVRGAIIKRGKGSLAIETAESADLVTGSGTMTVDGVSPNRPAEGFVYDDHGTVPPPTESYGGLNVVEGELVLRGTGAAPAQIELTESVRVGLPTATRSAGAADPALVLDNVAVTMNNGARPTLYVGGGATDENTVFTSPRLVVSNGASVTVHNIAVNRNSANDSSQSSQILVDGGTIDVRYRIYANASGRGTTASRICVRNGGALYVASSLDCYGLGALGSGANNKITLVVDGGIVAKSAAGDPMNFNAGNESSTLVFTNGARFCCSSFSRDNLEAGGANELYFDDSEWYPGEVDFTFGNNVGNSSRYYVTGRGLVLAPPASATYTWARKLQGTGGLVKRGEGTLVFPMTNLVATGAIAVEAGTLDLGGTTAEARTFSGSGAIRNGTLQAPVIKVSKDGAALDLGATALSGRVRVDFSEYGGDVPLRAAIPVARVSGAVDLSKWRGSGIDASGVRAAFAAEGGVVFATVDNSGMLLIVH